jgi:hypothetical protein
MMTTMKPKTDKQLWDSLQADAELERIKHLSVEALEAEVRADGGDPDAIGRRGAALAKERLAERGLDWKARAKDRAAETTRRAGAWPSFGQIPRAELRARIDAARADARFSAPVVAAFRKRSAEAATDDELRALLEEIEVLRRLHGEPTE